MRTNVVVPARYVDEEIYKDAHIIIEKYKITLNFLKALTIHFILVCRKLIRAGNQSVALLKRTFFP